MSKRVICTNRICLWVTSEDESEDRVFNTGNCAKCNSPLKPYSIEPTQDEQELECVYENGICISNQYPRHRCTPVNPQEDELLPTSLEEAIEKYRSAGGTLPFYVVSQDWMDDLLSKQREQLWAEEWENRGHLAEAVRDQAQQELAEAALTYDDGTIGSIRRMITFLQSKCSSHKPDEEKI